MTGSFELFHDEEDHFRFRLTAPDGTVMALSSAFTDKAAAVAGITAVREYAGMGLITDLCPEIPLHRPSAQTGPAARTTSPLPAVPPAAACPAAALPPRPAIGTPARPGHGTRGSGPRRHKVA